MFTTVTVENGWIIVRCGELEIVLPAGLDNGQDERAEIRCNGSRLWVESHDDGPLASKVERYSSKPTTVWTIEEILAREG